MTKQNKAIARVVKVARVSNSQARDALEGCGGDESAAVLLLTRTTEGPSRPPPSTAVAEVQFIDLLPYHTRTSLLQFNFIYSFLFIFQSF